MKKYSQDILDNVDKVSNNMGLPRSHKNYLRFIRDLGYNFYPKVVYDIGSCVLHWTYAAQETWPDAKIILFDATDIFEELYVKKDYEYHIDVLSKTSNEIVKFYQNNEMFAGNSYYRENPKYCSAAETLFDESKIIELPTITLDDIVKIRSFLAPDLIKIDVQGAELDVLIGADKSLETCKHLIVELRSVEYNIGSPEKEKIIDYLQTKGFKNLGMFCDNGPDGDYHFIKD